MQTKTKYLLTALGVTTAATGAVVVNGARQLVRIALDRQSPVSEREAKLLLSGSGEHHILLEKLDAAAAVLEHTTCETVEITARDGPKLIGHWHSCRNPERVILAMHGWRSSWARDFGAVAQFWHNRHCSVLYVEQRGQNESGGAYMSLGLMERYDCIDWIHWVEQQKLAQADGTQLPLYLCGVSMGATTVLMASGLNLPRCVHGIIADCGFTSPYEICRHVTEHNLHISYQLWGALIEYYCKRKLRMGTRDASTPEALKRCEVPVLLIHGTGDTFVPVEMTYENYTACHGPRHLFLVPGAGHGMSYFTDPKGYEAVIQAFWNTYDRQCPSETTLYPKPEPTLRPLCPELRARQNESGLS